MASSLALSGPANTPFAQTGQLDWVALSRMPVTYTLEVAARFCRAGVETVTILMGSAICSSFAFPPEGQAELMGSLSHSKGSSSYSKILWFGFGLKHIVHDLSTTEEGAACVAICTALATIYTPFQAAQVLRELSLLKGAPRQLHLTIHQWAALIQVCAGSLTRSKFPIYFDTFTRLLSPRNRATRSPANAQEIARALAILAKLSRKSLLSSTFVGGVECAWLAAVAECLLRLNIEIQDEQGQCIYQSSQIKPGGPIQGFFRRADDQVPNNSDIVIQQLFFISKGEDLLHERAVFSSNAIRNPTSWSNVFSDAFPVWDVFMSPPSKKAFTMTLIQLAIFSRAYFASQVYQSTQESLSRDLKWLCGYQGAWLIHPKRSGDDLLEFARSLLPELDLPSTTDLMGQLNVREAGMSLRVSIDDIRDICKCHDCDGLVRIKTPDNPSRQRCLERLAVTILRFILILSPVTLHPNIPPSTTALQQLYTCSAGHATGSEFALPCNGIMLVLFMFAGRLPTRTVPDSVSAASASGICVFLTLLKDIDLSPLAATEVEVIPGHIKHEDHFYTFIEDAAFEREPLNRFHEGHEAEFYNLSGRDFELVVEERQFSDTLGAKYSALNSGGFNLSIPIAGLQVPLQTFLRLNVADSDSHSALFNVEENGLNWSLQEMTSTRQPRTMAECTKAGTLSWSILCWKAHASDKSDPDQTQWLDIEIFRPQDVVIFLTVLQEYASHACETRWNRRCHVMLINIGSCDTSVVRRAALAWSALEPDRSVRSIGMNDLRKQILIRTSLCCHGQNCWDAFFELCLVSKTKDVPVKSKRKWNLFTKT